MGKFDFNFDADITRQLLRLADADTICPKILDEAAPILEKNIKKECEKHKRTGQLANSIKKTKAFKNEYGYFICVRPTGKSKRYKTVQGKTGTRKEPVRNMEIMAHLEYGTSKIAPIPIMTKGLKDSEEEVKQKMQEAYDRIVGGG